MDDLKRIAATVNEAALGSKEIELQNLECRLFESFRGDVTDLNAAAVCVRGIGNTRCIWFFKASVAPAP